MASAAPRKDHAKPDSPWRSRPRREVVGRHRGGEAHLLGVLDVAQEPAGGDLLVGAVESDGGHRSTQPHRGWGPVADLHGSPPARPAGRVTGPAVGRSRHGPPGGRRRRRGLGHGRRHDGLGAGAARGRRAGARARRAAPAGAGELVAGRGVHAAPLQAGRAVGGRRRGGRSRRGCTTSSGATPRSTAPRCRGSASRTSRRWRTSTGCRPRGRSATPTSSPTTARPSACTPCTARTGEDPTEPWRSTPFPYAALPHEPYVAALVERLRSAGVHPCSTAMGVDLRPGGRCVRCATCDGFPCRLGAKSDAEVCAVDPALATGSARLATGVRVERLVTDASGRRVVEAVGVGPRRAGDRARPAVRGVGGCGELRGAAAGLGEPGAPRRAWATPRSSSAAAS